MDGQAIIITIALAWAGWVSVFLIQTNIKANKSLSNDAVNEKEIGKIVENWNLFQSKFDRMEESVKEELQKTNNRLDVFLNNELTTLKSILQK